jgi:uncharacterized protein
MTHQPQLFIGRVMHSRLRPAVNAFVYPIFYVQLPLCNLAAARNRIFSINRFNLLQFNTKDHGPRDGSALLPWIQTLLREHDLPDDGDIILQCFPRVLGYVFNPVSFWFCRNSAGHLIAVLAEVRNTFGGHYCYLLHNADGSVINDGQELDTQKVFHVSPFCKIEGTYRFRFHLDQQASLVCIDYHDTAEKLLATSISGRAIPWSTAALLGALLKMPLLTLGVMLRIHWQALKLWRKDVPFYGAHSPVTSSSAQTSSRQTQSAAQLTTQSTTQSTM